ncbi:hypothetical protein ACWEHA_07655 [Amycolatopsis nivea]
MNKPARTATADIYLGYGFFVVTDFDAGIPSPDVAYANGLVGTDSSGAVVLAGITTGRVTVTLQILESEPDSVEVDGWDEVAEVSVDAEEGYLLVHNMEGNPPAELDQLAYVGPGSYRLRVHARGRDTAPHSNTPEPVEEYQISVWPAPDEPETVHKQSDKRGEEYRSLQS